MKLKYDKPLSNIAFSFNLRRYSLVGDAGTVAVAGIQKLSHALDEFAKHPNPADPLFFEQLRRLRDNAKVGHAIQGDALPSC